MGEDLDGLMLQRVRDAILKAGGVPIVAERTGIPKKTLEKYMAKRSMPSLANAAKIAEAAGMLVDELTSIRRSTLPLTQAEIAAFSIRLATAVHMSLVRIYGEESVKLPPAVQASEAERLFGVLLKKLERLGDFNEAEALMPWLENKIRSELREAAAAPGTGKREAS